MRENKKAALSGRMTSHSDNAAKSEVDKPGHDNNQCRDVCHQIKQAMWDLSDSLNNIIGLVQPGQELLALPAERWRTVADWRFDMDIYQAEKELWCIIADFGSLRELVERLMDMIPDMSAPDRVEVRKRFEKARLEKIEGYAAAAKEANRIMAEASPSGIAPQWEG